MPFQVKHSSQRTKIHPFIITKVIAVTVTPLPSASFSSRRTSRYVRRTDGTNTAALWMSVAPPPSDEEQMMQRRVAFFANSRLAFARTHPHQHGVKVRTNFDRPIRTHYQHLASNRMCHCLHIIRFPRQVEAHPIYNYSTSYAQPGLG